MANLFGDQLLKAGLVKKDQLNKAKKSKHKQRKQAGRQSPGTDSDVSTAAQQAAIDKAARDTELNRQKKAVADRKAIQAQIRQLIEMNRLALAEDNDVGYHFQDGSTVRKLFVSQEIQSKLQSGLLAIARFDAGYEVIPTIVAEKIKLRDETCIVAIEASQVESDEEDPYRDYQVPDDLMW
ncbi:MAG: DUF2058 domain-containing protein [Gammaproteobacteria bacterium]